MQVPYWYSLQLYANSSSPPLHQEEGFMSRINSAKVYEVLSLLPEDATNQVASSMSLIDIMCD